MLSDWLHHSIKSLDQTALESATLRQTQLTKPAGSLGRLEQIAIQLAEIGRASCRERV